ncbi:malate:quinone oxidoreductase [Klebsiella pneumoniae]|nr:malate:quinone oxidoreductase [Klebsiella pneumoniae]
MNCLRGIRHSEDHQQIKAWAPLEMGGRDSVKKARQATRSEVGTDRQLQ